MAVTEDGGAETAFASVAARLGLKAVAAAVNDDFYEVKYSFIYC